MLSLSCSWHRHVVVSDTWFSSAHHIVTHISISLFHIGSFLCFQSYQFVIYQLIICYENELPSSTREIAKSYLLHEAELPPSPNFKLPYLPNQANWDPGICTQLRSSHIHSIHQTSREFIKGNFGYLALICALWSSRGRAGKKVTAVTFMSPFLLMAYVSATISAETVLTKCANSIQIRYICELGYVWNRLTWL